MTFVSIGFHVLVVRFNLFISVNLFINVEVTIIRCVFINITCCITFVNYKKHRICKCQIEKDLKKPCGTSNMIWQYVMHALVTLVLCISYKELISNP